MQMIKSLLFGFIMLLGFVPSLQAQSKPKWDLRPLEHFNGNYDAFLKWNFNGISFDVITMGVLMDEHLKKITPPTYFAIYQITAVDNEQLICSILLAYHPMELIRKYTQEKRDFSLVMLVVRYSLKPEDPKFKALKAAGVNKFLPWNYKKYYDILKDIEIEDIYCYPADDYTPLFLKNTPE